MRFFFTIGRRAALLAALLVPALAPAQPTAPVAPIPNLPFWNWQLGQPTGFGLDVLHVFNDSTVVVAGGHGTALKTASYGRSWQVLPTGIDREITSVSFANPLVGWLGYETRPTVPTRDYLAGPGRLLRTTDGGQTWASQGMGDAVSSIRNPTVAAASPTEAYLAYQRTGIGPGPNYYPLDNVFEMRHTTNGGQSWTLLPIGFNFRSSGTIKLYFPTPATGLVLTKDYAGLFSYLYRTTDHGQTWQDVGPAAGNGGQAGFVVNNISFLDAQRGWAVGNVRNGGGAGLYRTTNGGQSWTALTTPTPNDLYSEVTFADPLHAQARVYYGDFVTNDGGLTWIGTATNLPWLTGYNPVVRLQPSGAGWRIDRLAGGVLATTADFGRTWQSHVAVPTAGLVALAFPDPTHGWALPGTPTAYDNSDNSPTTVLHTTRRGAPWQRQELYVPGQYLALATGAFPDADTAWVAGGGPNATGTAIGGALRYTTSGGRSWAPQALPPATPALTELACWGTGRLLALTAASDLYVSRSGGRGWAAPQRPAPPRRRLYRATWADSATVYITTDSSVFLKSSDAGRSWRTLPFPFRPLQGQAFTFTSSRVGYLTLRDVVTKTTDGGLTWTNIDLRPVSTTLPAAYSQQDPNALGWNLSFTTARKGWLFGQNDVLKTTDAGQTWQHVAYVGAVGSFASGTGPSVLLDDYNAFGAGSGLSHYSEKFVQADTLAAQPRRYCPGQALTLAYTTEGTLTATERANLRLQLSNPMGRVRQGQTWLLAPAPGGTATALAATLPAALPAGTRYRLRVITADSALLGGDNGRDLAIAPLPTAAISPAGPALRVCAGSTLTLTAPAGQTQYLWSTGATTRTIAVGAAGSYTVQVAGAAGCLGPPSPAVAVAVDALAQATITPAGPTLAVCAGSTATLTAPAGLVQYLWSTGATTRSIAVGAAGSYTVRGASAAGCLGPPSVAVAVALTPLPAVPVLARDAASGQLAVAAPLAGATYAWTFNGAVLAGVSGPQYPATGAGAAPAGTYTATATAGGCTSAASAPLVVVLAVRAATEAELRLYPNPARDLLVLERPAGEGPAEATLLDALGRTVLTAPAPAGRTALDVRALPEGLYVLRLALPNGGLRVRSVQVRR